MHWDKDKNPVGTGLQRSGQVKNNIEVIVSCPTDRNKSRMKTKHVEIKQYHALLSIICRNTTKITLALAKYCKKWKEA